MELFFDRTRVGNIDELVSRFGSKAFASPFRSTVPLIALVKDEPHIFDHVAAACGCSSRAALHFEYKVTPPAVEANASQTDAMVFSPEAAVAIEAKWTEPRYETVARRLKNRVRTLCRAHPNIGEEEHRISQLAVISGWLALLDRYTVQRLTFDSSAKAIYQMIHRAASVCAAPQPKSSLAYLHFSPPPGVRAASADQYRSDLVHLHELMGSPADFSFYFVDVPLDTTADFAAIASLPKGKRETHDAVRNALITTRLFRFQTPKIERIG